MRIGLGLPAAVPNADPSLITTWAAAADAAGYSSVGVIDRLVYDNLEPLTALAAAAAVTTKVELLTTVLNIGWRANPVLLAKRIASVDLLSGGRLTAGLGLGGWPEDFDVSGVPAPSGGRSVEHTVSTMRQVWNAEVTGQGGPTRRLSAGRPGLLFGGLVPAAHLRAARIGDGWVAPLMGFELLQAGATAVRAEWARLDRAGGPRIVTGRYVSLGPDAGRVADDYLQHYYGEPGWSFARADTPTTPDQLHEELARLEEAGVSDVVLFPCSAEVTQLDLLTEALSGSGRLSPISGTRATAG
jgi:alkanesulfonate monooxygenase SsuD/methylene tetrahydromethanopterin reductase-like flavin-dependent oxidoreductase (luciferase family)